MFDIHFTKFITVSWITIIWVLLIIVHFLALGGGLIVLSRGAYEATERYTEAQKRAADERREYERGNLWHEPTEPPKYAGPSWQFLVLPLAVVVSLLITRMSLELVVILFRNEANTRVTKEYYMRVMKEKNMEMKWD